jgi:ribose 5-phosphate isomerase A
LFKRAGFANVRIDMRGSTEKPLITDSGHYLLDCHLQEVADPDVLAANLKQIPGVVEHGLFIGIATDAVIGKADGTAEAISFST